MTNELWIAFAILMGKYALGFVAVCLISWGFVEVFGDKLESMMEEW